MSPIEEPFLQAEVAYRRQRIASDWGTNERRQRRRKVRRARRQHPFRVSFHGARAGVA